MQTLYTLTGVIRKFTTSYLNMSKSKLMPTTQPVGWVEAFKTQAEIEGLSLSDWVGQCCRANLPLPIQKKLLDRPAANRPTITEQFAFQLMERALVIEAQNLTRFVAISAAIKELKGYTTRMDEAGLTVNNSAEYRIIDDVASDLKRKTE